MISIEEAAATGVERVRKPIWADPLDHVKIDIIDGKPGPWLHLWCPFNKECNGRDPVDNFAYQWDLSVPEFEPYTGPLPSSEEYQKAAAKFDGVLGSKLNQLDRFRREAAIADRGGAGRLRWGTDRLTDKGKNVRFARDVSLSSF